jgi:acetyltransferase-like isoleucine patch superfamily enzyme
MIFYLLQFFARILVLFYKYEGLNLLLRIMPSKYTVSILRSFGAKIGDRVVIQNPLTLHNAENNEPILKNLEIGEDVYIGRFCFLDLASCIVIGNRVTISHYCTINTHVNVGKSPLFKRIPTQTASVTIRDGAYLGCNVTILHGSSVGEESIVGACALVNKNVPSLNLAVGVPVKISPVSQC